MHSISLNYSKHFLFGLSNTFFFMVLLTFSHPSSNSFDHSFIRPFLVLPHTFSFPFSHLFVCIQRRFHSHCSQYSCHKYIQKWACLPSPLNLLLFLVLSIYFSHLSLYFIYILLPIHLPLHSLSIILSNLNKFSALHSLPPNSFSVWLFFISVAHIIFPSLMYNHHISEFFTSPHQFTHPLRIITQFVKGFIKYEYLCVLWIFLQG